MTDADSASIEAQSEATSNEEDHDDEINLDQDTTEVTIETTTQTDASNTEEVSLTIEQNEEDPIEADENLDVPVATETLMSEDGPTMKESTLKVEELIVSEPQVPESNPKHEAIRADILALIDNYDDTQNIPTLFESF